MLAGYGYAFGASRWVHPRPHVVLHAVLLAAPALVLPFMIQAGSASPPDGNPLAWLLVLLAGSIGLVLDAFSSASIPIHLMTREAVGLYLSRLASDGVLLMHLSNRHLRLAPIVARLAESHGLVAVQQIESAGPNWPEGKNPSHWVVMARDAAGLGALANDSRWSTLAASASTPLWTDDSSNILSVLSVR